MVIDFHTHIFPDLIAGRTIEKLKGAGGFHAYTDGTLKGLKTSMNEAGIDYSVILPVATNPGQFKSINDFATKLNAENSSMISLGGIHPDSGDFKGELAYIKNLGLKGIKLHPDYQGTFIDDIRMMRIIDYAAELEMVIVAHAGFDVAFPDTVHCTPDRVENLLRHTSPDKLVLAHMGGMRYWDQVEERLVGKKVYFDTSFSLGIMEDEQFVRITKNHGAEKIIFGTDSPWSGQKEMLVHIRRLKLTEEELERMLYRNAKELLGI